VLPASAPVCATIERRAASLRPSGAHTRIGFRAFRSASSPRSIPSTSRIVSTYVVTSFVCGSSAAHANMSPSPITASFPTPRMIRSPTPRSEAIWFIVHATVPDWLITLIPPATGSGGGVVPYGATFST